MSKKYSVANIILAVVGIFLVGSGIAFNAGAALGNDPIGIVYDGVRNAADLSAGQLGIASNVVNIVLMIIVFFAGRRYINIGTFIYVLPYGLAVDLGGHIYRLLFQNQTLAGQIAGAVIGCLLLYIGVAMFITADIGLDPFTGLVMTMKDIWHKDYPKMKIGFDICMIIIGVILGGKLGVITVVTACLAGPSIQFMADQMNKIKKDRRNKR